MSNNKTDLTFFTNDAEYTLLDRFKSTLKNTQFFDILVGYFYSSGFYQLYDSIKDIEKTRILVGIGTDHDIYQALHFQRRQLDIDFESHKKTKQLAQEILLREIENSTASDEQLEVGLRAFIEFLCQDSPNAEKDRKMGGNGKKLEIRAFPSRDLHAKVYIGRFAPDDRDYGFVITGSSNFSYSGLVANREFNVELRQRYDVEFALEQFENLWNESVDISEEFVKIVRRKTWLNDSITPYELYLKLIYEYMQEDINLVDNDIEVFLPDGFMSLKYQKQAVIQALKKLEEFNGVFLSDVVGLGKTFITTQLLQRLQGQTLVICPPSLKEYWEESLRDFRVPAKVESLGKLHHILNREHSHFQYIVIDEAHRFRNENTQSYAALLDICRGKKVILVTATPLNNTVDDIYAQLKLFQPPRNSTIPGLPNLEKYFQKLRYKFHNIERQDSQYKKIMQEVSDDIRERILKHTMVRRTRTDILTYFKEDVEKQGLFFPNIEEPRKIIYTFQGQLEKVFNNTINLLKEFHYSRYTPLLYYDGSKQLTAFEQQQQRNIGGFMKAILLKRLESSFYAFRQSIERFIHSYEQFIEMFRAGTLYISKKVDVYELLDRDDFETLEKLVKEEKAQRYSSKDFRPQLLEDLRHDLKILKKIRSLWKKIKDDPKLETLSRMLKQDSSLKNRKIIIFTESQETGEYLFHHFNESFSNEVLFFSSRGGLFGEEHLSPSTAREKISSAFDPNRQELNKKLRILIATDVLAEGINLHRANIIINYDLPWNPTRILQRVGRINRLGTQHKNLFIYNCFPTTQADSHLGLENNITNKIQMFHSILGEDAKYLSDGEEIGSQELFETLNDKKTYIGEDAEIDSELKYLEMMRQIRDHDPELFQKIKNLPPKARSGRIVGDISHDQLITFFRIGKLKKFYINKNNRSEEITFFEAVKLLECEPNTPRHRPPDDYFKRLECNKQQFTFDSTQVEETPRRQGRNSNANYVERRLKDKAFRRNPKLTNSDQEFIEGVLYMFRQGTIAKKTINSIKKELEKTSDPLEMLAILRKYIRQLDPPSSQRDNRLHLQREVILSAYLIAQGDRQ